jgi:hypothetical protein
MRRSAARDRNPGADMDDVSTPSPWQQTSRFDVRTQLEPLDYAQLMRVVRWSGRERMVAWFAAFGMSGLGALIALITLEPFAAGLPVYAYWDWGLAIAIGGALVAFLLYKVFVMGPYVDSMFKGQPIGMGETTIVADTAGVNATSAGIATHVPWDKIQDVIIGNNHLFLMFGRLTGLIVPRRAFADESEAQRFADFVRSMTHKPG